MSEASSPPPLPPPHAWVMEALVASPETDTFALAELLVQNTGFWSRPSMERERVAIRFLEEYLALWIPSDGNGDSESPFLAGDSSRVPGLDESDACQFDRNQSSEDVLNCFMRKLKVSGPTKTCKDTAFINSIRQFTQQKRSTMPKCFLEQLTDRICSEKTSPSTKITKTKCILLDSSKGGARVCQASKNDDKASSENKAKLTETPANNSTAGLNTEMAGNDVNDVIEQVQIPTSPPPVKNTIPEQNGVVSPTKPRSAEYVPDSDHESVQETTSGEDEQPFNFDAENKIIASEKRKLIDFQNGSAPDLMTGIVTQAAQQCSCVKCDEGGELLICSANSCTIAVHENCLGSAAVFSDRGEFVCPFCSYTRATAAYCDARKKFSLAKKALSSFMGWGPSLRWEASKPPKSKQPTDLKNYVKRQGVKEKASRITEATEEGKHRNTTLDGVSNHTRERFSSDKRSEGLSRDRAVKQGSNRITHPTEEGKRGNCPVDGGRNDIPTRKQGVVGDGRDKTDVSDEAVKRKDSRGTEPTEEGKGANIPVDDGCDGVPIIEEEFSGDKRKKSNSCCAVNQELKFVEIATTTRTCMSGRTLRSAPNGHSNDNFAKDDQQSTSSPFLSFSEHDLQNDTGMSSDAANSPQKERETTHSKEVPSNSKRKKKKSLTRKKRQTETDLVNDDVSAVESSSESHTDSSNNGVYVSALEKGEKARETSSEVNSKKRKAAAMGSQIHNQPQHSFSSKERKCKRSSASASHLENSGLHLPRGRRNRLPWTAEEEEVLKEAMQNITHCGKNGGIPWIDVLEYGRHVFHKTRQPEDLRFKWRNIQKKAPEKS